MLKSPIGLVIAAGSLILALSPEARKTARRWAVKGTELLLETSDQIKAAASSLDTSRLRVISGKEVNAVPIDGNSELRGK
jgi:hypothetical protein